MRRRNLTRAGSARELPEREPECAEAIGTASRMFMRYSAVREAKRTLLFDGN